LSPRLGIGTIKYDSNGNALWFTNYGGIRSTDVPVGLKLDGANNVVIIASSENFEDGGPQWATLKYSTEGNLQWARGVAGAAFSAQRPGGLALDPGGNVYVTGAVVDESAQPIITTVKYGPDGSDIWTARFQESAWSGVGYGAMAVGVHLAPVGRVLVAGAIGWTDRDVLVLAYAQESSSNAPVLLQSPRALVVFAGTPAIFSVVFSNATHVQWLRNGVAIPGATNAVFRLAAALPEDWGRYSVRISNGDYCVETAGARLVVEAGPQPYLLPELHSTALGLEIRFVALPYASYILQASSDLVNWESLGAFYHDGGGTQVCIDPAPQLPARRFYRLTLSQPEP
jgi:hypothetical protein